MSVLSALQSASIKLVSRKPIAFFGSSGEMEMELCDLVTDVGRDISERHDWRALSRLATIVGDGATVAHPLPDGYARMPKKAEVHSATWTRWRYHRVSDFDEWQDLQTFSGISNPGSWFIVEGKFQIFPAVPLGDQAKFYYQTGRFVRPASGADKAAFGADDDQFVLDERLLMLGLVWRWRHQKRMEYAEDMQNFEVALAQTISADKGARILTTGPSGARHDVRQSYPGPLG